MIKHILIAIDQLLNALLLGYADETLSARAWRMRAKNKKWALAVTLINGLFFWQANHCRGAFYMELKRKHMPREYR